jgi:two-component system, chemotaxis family, sensor kinase CheA
VITIDTSHASAGILGATIIDGKSVEIVDVSDLIAPTGRTEEPHHDDPVDVMVVEHSEFFRALFAPLLQQAGYKIAVMASIKSARLALSQRAAQVLVLDLDQPGEAAFELVRDLKAANPNGIRVIGLVSRGGQRVIEKAKAAGFDDLVGKFDRQGMLAAIAENIGADLSRDWGVAA